MTIIMRKHLFGYFLVFIKKYNQMIIIKINEYNKY